MRVAILFLVMSALTACGQGDRSGNIAPSLDAQRSYDPLQLQRGSALFAKHCVTCHGEKGAGKILPWNVRQADGFYPPPPLDDSAHAWHHSTQLLARMVREGSEPGQGTMPAWKGTLSEAEIADVVIYVTSLWSDEKYQLWFEQIETPARQQDEER